jgi:hypothetical protein
MAPLKFAICSAIAVFIAGLAGLALQRIVPEKHLTGAPRDMVGAVVGLLGLLSALVLGLLIWTAYGVYSAQNLAIQTLAGKVLQFDLALSDYGPEADKIRAQLKENLAKTIDEVWHPGRRVTDADFAAENFKGAIRNLRAREPLQEALHPTTDQEKQALTAATAAMDAIGQTRMQMSFALASPVSYPLVIMVVTWAALLFFGYGLMSKANAVSMSAVLIGAVAVASATLLVLDLSNPYSGLFRVSSAPLKQVLAVLGNE